ncbi:MAG: PepSY domain-containing protein [Actinophytocola sp.]|uniref:PepSY domain-containing protein n=1 Tax=Actinophytocola sp. TaxID=1872138 RepID=UPI003D6BD98D
MKRMIIVAVVAAGLIAAGASIAFATGQQDDNAGPDGTDQPITGPALDRVEKAALEHTGGGRVTETEVGDEEGYYEVEVTVDDGRQVDVHLDENFAVLGSAGDSKEDSDEGR